MKKSRDRKASVKTIWSVGFKEGALGEALEIADVGKGWTQVLCRLLGWYAWLKYELGNLEDGGVGALKLVFRNL